MNVSIKKIIFLVFVCLNSQWVFGMFSLVNYDTIYNKDIASVKFFQSGLPLSMPVIDLVSDGSLTLQFDDLRSGNRRYRYEVFHLDKNWQKDALEEIDYVQGFNRSQIKDFAYSTNRNIDYTFYKLNFPNNEIKLKISGNYLIHVYEDIRKDEREYIFTRRFMVVENKVKVHPIFVRPTDGLKYRTNQELDIEVNIKGFPIYNSRQEISLSVMQNARWGTLLENIVQNRDKTDYLVFDYIDKITFPAGKEFRYFDTRSLRFRSRFVKKITENRDETIVTLNNDKIRDEFKFLNEKDANGNYIIDNADKPQGDLSSEYTWVDFTLNSPEFTENKVYVIGGFSDWECKEENLMKYDAGSQAYLGSAFVKQGYYNYTYVVMDRQGHFTSSPIDGDWYETENDYQIMVYYHPFGSRYDQLIAFYSANSLSGN